MRTAPGRRKLTLLQWLARRVGLRAAPLGDRGEAAAARFLRGQGMKIIARNRVHGRGEIDIIAIDKTHLVFVEVRTRRSDDFVTPEASIRHHKRRKIVSTARGLVRRHGKAGLTPRIDVVAVVWPAGAKKPEVIRHHRAAIALSGW